MKSITLSLLTALLLFGNTSYAQNETKSAVSESTVNTTKDLLTGMIEPEDAKGAIKAMYEGSQKKFGTVINGMKMHTYNPQTAIIYGKLGNYFEKESNLSDLFRLFSNAVIANIDQSPYCLALMENVVGKKLNIPKEQFYAMLNDPSKLPLNEADMALVEFVIKIIKDSKSSTKADIEKLNSLGFSDKDIFDAIDYATYKQKLHLMFNILKTEKD